MMKSIKIELLGRQKKFFNIAKKYAESNKLQFKMAAILVPSYGHEYFVGLNTIYKTHTISDTRYGNIHAELSALMSCGLRNYKKIKGSDIFLYRHASYGMAISKPCIDCEVLLKKYEVKRVFYTNKDGFYEMDLRR